MSDYPLAVLVLDDFTAGDPLKHLRHAGSECAVVTDEVGIEVRSVM